MKLHQFPTTARLSERALRISTNGKFADLQCPRLGSMALTEEELGDLNLTLSMSHTAFRCALVLLREKEQEIIQNALFNAASRDESFEVAGPEGTRLFDRFTQVHSVGDTIEIRTQAFGHPSTTFNLTNQDVLNIWIYLGMDDKVRRFSNAFRAHYGDHQDEVSTILIKAAGEIQ